ncbi:MAG: DUF4010 domain-containing protein [Pseudorhodoplanes sp.]|jgi:uncharacterized membrane protein (DUF4010 family)|nr:DUF4010 domain-containing protein [Pseudorhodoplanes sp.]
MMPLQEILSQFAVALGIGLLIGLERGWTTRKDQPGSRTAGFRTFAITGVLGGTVGAIAQASGGAASVGGGLVLGLGFAAYSVVIAVFCLEENRADKNFSATTAIAAMSTFVLSAYAVVGDMRVAGAAAIVVTLLLFGRERMHGWLRQITGTELRSALVLLAMTFIILPMVPDDPVGPFGGVNLREIWLLAIVLAGVSFLGYVSVKYFGAHHGVLLAAAAGGLASSTAVTAANARYAAAGEGAPHILAAGVALATTISFLRVLTVATVMNPALLRMLAPPLLAAGAVTTIYAFVSVYWRRTSRAQQSVKFRNPFSFWSVVGFAVLLGIVVLFGRVLGETLGAAGAIVGAFGLGLADVDAVTVSMARLAPQPLSLQEASFAILAAVLSNTLSKMVIGAIVGRGRFALEIMAVSVACLAVGGLALAAALAFLGGD